MPNRPSTDLAVYIRLILARKFAIAAFAFVVMVVAAIAVLLMGESYESHVKLLVQNPEFLEESTVTSEPLSVKTMENLAKDISLIGAILERFKSDYDLLDHLARTGEVQWRGDEDDLPEVSQALAGITSVTDVRRWAGDVPVPEEQAQRVAGYDAGTIQGILEADREGLEQTDPIYFQENFKVNLSIDTQTAYAIVYQPVVQLTATMGTAKSATALATMWRDMLLARLTETLGRFTGETASDLRRKRDNAKQRWLTAIEQITLYQEQHNVVVQQSELQSLERVIDEELLPNYYAALAKSATAQQTFEILESEVDRRLGEGGWLGSSIRSITHARELLVSQDQVESTTLAELERQQRDLVAGVTTAAVAANGQVTSVSPELEEKIDEVVTDLKVRREIIRAWIALDRARERRLQFLEESDLDAKQRQLEDLKNFVASDRQRMATAAIEISSASAAIQSIQQQLQGEPRTVEVETILDSGEIRKQNVPNEVYVELQQTLNRQLSRRSSARGRVEGLSKSLEAKEAELQKLQEEVNKLEQHEQVVEQQLTVAQTNYDNLQEDYLDLRNAYRVARSKAKIYTGAANALRRMLTEHQEQYRRLHERVKKHMDTIETYEGEAASERETYVAIADKYAEAELVINEEFQPVRAWGEPREPLFRASPRRTTTVLAAGFLAGLAAMAFFVFRELIEPTRIA